MLRLAVLLCAVACAKVADDVAAPAAPLAEPQSVEPLVFEFRLDELRRKAGAQPPGHPGQWRLIRFHPGAYGHEGHANGGISVGCARWTEEGLGVPLMDSAGVIYLPRQHSLSVSAAVDSSAVTLVPQEHVFGCPEILPGVAIVVRFVEAP